MAMIELRAGPCRTRDRRSRTCPESSLAGPARPVGRPTDAFHVAVSSELGTQRRNAVGIEENMEKLSEIRSAVMMDAIGDAHQSDCYGGIGAMHQRQRSAAPHLTARFSEYCSSMTITNLKPETGTFRNSSTNSSRCHACPVSCSSCLRCSGQKTMRCFVLVAEVVINPDFIRPQCGPGIKRKSRYSKNSDREDKSIR